MTAAILITIFLFALKVVRRWEKKDKAKVVPFDDSEDFYHTPVKETKKVKP